MSRRVTPRIKDLNPSSIVDLATQKVFEQINSQSKILDIALSHIRNLKFIRLVNIVFPVLLTTYSNAGSGAISLNDFDREEIQTMVFSARSGNVGTGGMTVQLYDVSHNTEIATVIFVAADDDSVKTISVKDYFDDFNGDIILEANVKRTGAGAGSDLNCGQVKVT